MSLLANSNAIEDTGYNIQRSLRFRSSASAYLSRTPASAGNRTTWTWSGWVKRGTIGTRQTLFGGGSNATSTDHTYIEFYSSGTILIESYSSSASLFKLETTPVYRDFSAWYHIALAIDTTQATSSNRVKLYVNGVQVTAFGSATYPSLNYAGGVNAAAPHRMGSYSADYGPNYFDGYLAEVNFIDGQALTPSSFGQTDAVTGVWTPKKYTGTYGTNGFYLPFSDNTSATTLAYDKSGNSNNWTPNNISTTAGATYDSMTDVPTLTSATAANFCVLNPLLKGEGTIGSQYTITAGNLNYNGSDGAMWVGGDGSIGVSSGKWYYECVWTGLGSGAVIGWVMTQTPRHPGTGAFGAAQADTGIGFAADTSVYTQGSATSLTNSGFTTNDVLGMAIDLDSRTMTLYKNGSAIGGASNINVGTYWPGIGGYGTFTALLNFGQRPFSQTVPNGYAALNTFNLPDPTIKKPNQYMDAGLYTGTGSATAIPVSGPPNPDLVWIKGRSVAYSHSLLDNQRTTGTPYSRRLYSNLTSAEYDYGSSLLSTTSTGFNLTTTDGDHNTNGASYVAWQWKKGATPGFDIVTYTGNGSNGQAVAHSLGVTPKMVILKARSSALDWIVYHAGTTTPSTNNLILNSTAAAGSNSGFLTPNASNLVFTTSYGANNPNGVNMVAYCFAEIPGFSKFGSYTGNGSADGPFVYCGFRPKYVMWKRTDTTSAWFIYDSVRGTTNVMGPELYPNASDAEATTTRMDFVSNGFKLRAANAGDNASGGTYIFAAFAENPFKYSLAR